MEGKVHHGVGVGRKEWAQKQRSQEISAECQYFSLQGTSLKDSWANTYDCTTLLMILRNILTQALGGAPSEKTKKGELVYPVEPQPRQEKSQ